MRFYVVKYALSSGIQEREGECRDNGLYRCKKWGHLFTGQEVAETLGEAIEKAEALRAKKLLSISKQIQRIKSIDFHSQEIDREGLPDEAN